jgi:hypothetical protein
MRKAGLLVVAPAVEDIDLFKVAGRSISGWIPSLKTGAAVRYGTVKALIPSWYTEHQEGIRAHLQNVDGRSLMQSTFPCHVQANAHDWRQMLMFEGQTCSLGRAFTKIKEADWKIFRQLHAVGLERYCQRVTEEEFARFSQETQNRVAALLGELTA